MIYLCISQLLVIVVMAFVLYKKNQAWEKLFSILLDNHLKRLEQIYDETSSEVALFYLKLDIAVKNSNQEEREELLSAVQDYASKDYKGGFIWKRKEKEEKEG